LVRERTDEIREAGDDGVIVGHSRQAMKTPNRRAPATLPPEVSDLVAEGGNVLAADDALLDETAYVQLRRTRVQPDEYSFDADLDSRRGVTVPPA